MTQLLCWKDDGTWKWIDTQVLLRGHSVDTSNFIISG